MLVPFSELCGLAGAVVGVAFFAVMQFMERLRSVISWWQAGQVHVSLRTLLPV